MNKKIDISKTTLMTKRLILRPWTFNDLNDLYEYAKVPGVGEMAGWNHHKSIEESKRILDLFIIEKKTFAIEYEAKVIGSFGIEKYNEEKFPQFNHFYGREIGFVLSKDYWGKGLVVEACKEVIEFLFKQYNLDFILCAHTIRNKQSARVQEKCGFKHYKDGMLKTQRGTEEKARFNIFYKESFFIK